MNVVGTMFFEDQKLLIDKPRLKKTYQMVGGKVEKGETPLAAAIRECHEELGSQAIFDEENFKFIMEFDEISTSSPDTKIHFYIFEYTGKLSGTLTESDEIEGFLWYNTELKDTILSNTLKNEIIPYCLERKLIK